MKLVSFRVEKFRNIVDSTMVQVQPDVTCLVGKNESGKTAGLNALYRLKPAYGEKFSESNHYPRWLRATDRRAGTIDGTTPINGWFELEDDDVAAIEDEFGKGVLKDREFKYGIKYDGGSIANLEHDEAVAIASFFANSAASQTAIDMFKELPDMVQIRDAVKAKKAEIEADGVAADDPAGLAADIEKLDNEITDYIGENSSTWHVLVRRLYRRMPTFFYFSDYSVLPGRIDLQEIAALDPAKPASTNQQTAKALLSLAGTTVDNLSDDQYEDRKSELESVSNDLTDQVFEYWSQNDKLQISMDVDKETVTDEDGEHAVSRYLDVRVRDDRHGFTNNFSQRSAGFKWFFSFLAAFSEFEGKNDKVIVLLDEPGSALHAKAQSDFLRFIDVRLAPVAQVLYTTHSPFMVEPGKLERVRVVEDKGAKKGTELSSEIMSVKRDTLFPLQAALGYDIAQNLFIGPDNVLVEGSSDFTYLVVFSDYFKTIGREALDDAWRILPVGGIANVPSFVALMGAKLDVTVFVDTIASGSKQRITNLTTQGLLNSKKLITVEQITGTKSADVEDLFDPADYLSLYNPAFSKKLTVAKLQPGDRIVDRIGRTEGTPFVDHGKPADYLLRNRDKLLDKFSPATLDNFEEAIKRINATKGK